MGEMGWFLLFKRKEDGYFPAESAISEPQQRDDAEIKCRLVIAGNSNFPRK
jgi:hypothetical protein